MKIAFISILPIDTTMQRAGAIEQVIYMFYKFFIQRGHCCHILSGEFTEFDVTKSLRLLDNCRLFYKKLVLSIYIAKYLRKKKYDIIMIWDIVPMLIIFIFAQKLRSKIVYTMSSSRWPAIHSKNLYKRFIINTASSILSITVLRKIGVTVVQNAEYLKWFSKRVESAKLALVPPPICVFPPLQSESKYNKEVAILSTLANKKVILFVGRKVYTKGLETLIYASKILYDSGINNFVLLLVGPNENWGNYDTYYIKKLKHLTSELALNDIVIFVGPVDRSSLAIFYKSCDVFVLPSLSEAFGHVITEAMSFGKPVIGSNVDGIKMQVQDGVNGFLVEPGNYYKFAEKIKLLITNEELRTNMGLNAKKSSERFRLEKIALVYESLAKNLL